MTLCFIGCVASKPFGEIEGCFWFVHDCYQERVGAEWKKVPAYRPKFRGSSVLGGTGFAGPDPLTP